MWLSPSWTSHANTDKAYHHTLRTSLEARNKFHGMNASHHKFSVLIQSLSCCHYHYVAVVDECLVGMQMMGAVAAVASGTSGGSQSAAGSSSKGEIPHLSQL